jgi:hypothetical protein
VPVPPFPSGRMPVTSEARLMSAVETAPAVALRNPDRVPRVSELLTIRLEVDAVPFDNIWNVEVAERTLPFAA